MGFLPLARQFRRDHDNAFPARTDRGNGEPLAQSREGRGRGAGARAAVTRPSGSAHPGLESAPCCTSLEHLPRRPTAWPTLTFSSPRRLVSAAGQVPAAMVVLPSPALVTDTLPITRPASLRAPASPGYLLHQPRLLHGVRWEGRGPPSGLTALPALAAAPVSSNAL